MGKKTHPDTFASCWYNYRLCIFCANPGYHVFKRNVTWGRSNGFFFVHIFMFTITYIQSTILKAVPEWSVFEAFASLSWCASYISIVDIAWYCSILKVRRMHYPFQRQPTQTSCAVSRAPCPVTGYPWGCGLWRHQDEHRHRHTVVLLERHPWIWAEVPRLLAEALQKDGRGILQDSWHMWHEMPTVWPFFLSPTVSWFHWPVPDCSFLLLTCLLDGKDTNWQPWWWREA